MKRNLIIGITTGILLATLGIFYSCNYNASRTTPSLVTGLSGDNTYDAVGTDSNDISINESNKNTDVSNNGVTNDDFSDTSTDYLSYGVSETKLYVHICGAVINPGVYKIDAGARLIDLIILAGGLSDAAAEDYINQAQAVSDGQRIYIPTRMELEELSTDEYIQGETIENNENTQALININKSGLDELMTLPGIGQAKADSIIAYRSKNGSFSTIDELMKIPGIKEGLFNKISDYITVD